MHCAETEFGAESDALPDGFFRHDEVREAFADLRGAGKGGDVDGCKS